MPVNLTQWIIALVMLILSAAFPALIILRVILNKRAAERSRKAYAAVGTDSWGNPL